MCSHGMPTGAVRSRVGRIVAAEEGIRLATARQAAGTQARLTAVAPSGAETAAPSEVVIEGARQGISAAAGTAACPLREAAVGVEAASAAGVEAVAAAEVEAVEVVVAEAEVAAAAGSRPLTTHPLSKGGKNHGAVS
jgi:hypothetical protein